MQAIGDESLTLFNNQGYSEVFSFTYGSPCPVSENQQVTITGKEQVMIDWDTDPVQTAYQLRFRLKNDSDAIWHSQESFTGNAEINHLLSAGKQYECQVKARCNDHQSEYSNPTAFTLPESLMETFQCGILDTDTTVANREPKTELWPDEEIYNGQFAVRLVQVSGGNGLFSGIGRVRIPFLGNIQVMVEFTNIQVNELNQIYAGELRSIYNPD
ncbi:MAG: fibronectin type III domain-containing protein, partial [Cyclobacteriaceae bacterium]